MDQVNVDLIGEFDPPSEGHRYIMVLVDVASRFCWLRPLKDKSAAAVADELLRIVGDFGWPRILASDNGTEFANSVLDKVVKLLSMEHILSTPYHPQGKERPS
eukprot:Lithocolla_globosa_v1_NODE_3676_length_1609_cov_4.326255.p4 type:complete len:103 gc:universal NODE_3676_length_1609_cov_4.326255:1315-1007(-)